MGIDLFPEAFRDFGKVIGYNHRPNVDTMVKPVLQKLRRLPLTLREEFRRSFDAWRRLMLSKRLIYYREFQIWLSHAALLGKFAFVSIYVM